MTFHCSNKLFYWSQIISFLRKQFWKYALSVICVENKNYHNLGLGTLDKIFQNLFQNLHLTEDISPLMAVTDLNLTVHPHLHLTVHLHQHMAVMVKPTHHLHLMNLTVHLHLHMAVMAKPTHHLHLMNLMVHLHLHMAVMAKPTHHLHLMNLIHPQHTEDIANPHLHQNLTVRILFNSIFWSVLFFISVNMEGKFVLAD